MKPIVSYFKHPYKRIINIAARALMLLLQLTDNKYHYTLWSTREIIMRLREIQNKHMNDEKDYEVYFKVEDIKNMFTSLPHDKILLGVK